MKKLLHNNTRLTLLCLLVIGLLGGVALAQQQGLFRSSRETQDTAQRPKRKPMPQRDQCVYQYDKRAYGGVDAVGGTDGLLEVSQIPQEVVDRMSTECLVKSVLEYPHWTFALTRNSEQEGIVWIRERFYGLDSLLKRPEAPSAMLKTYQTFDLSQFEDKNLEVRANASQRLRYLGLMLGQPEVVAGFSQEQKITLLIELVDKRGFQQKAEFVGELTSSLQIEPLAIAAARTMLSMSEVNFQQFQQKRPEVEYFVQTAETPAYETLDTIFNAAIEVINGRPISMETYQGLHLVSDLSEFNLQSLGVIAPLALATSSPCTGNLTPINVYTPRGTRLQGTCRVLGDMNSTDRTRSDNWVRQNFPRATLLRSSTKKYNCHSYAWNNQSTSNDVWIGVNTTTAEDAYWNDRSYEPVCFANSAIPDYVVSYTSDDHSARTVSKYDTYNVISKWGQLALVKHAYNNSPYNSRSILYYDRKR